MEGIPAYPAVRLNNLENVSQLMVTPKWQLIRAFERLNKGKDVVKGKAARIDTVAWNRPINQTPMCATAAASLFFTPR
jgi:hypothetical protein